MKIAFDAFFLSERNITGIAAYSRSLLNALSVIDNQNEYYLYTPSFIGKYLSESTLKNPHFKLIKIKGIFPKHRKLWLQSPALRKSLIKEEIELFFGGGEYVPLFLPKKIKIIPMIHDLVYKLFPQTVSKGNAFFYKTLFPIGLKKATALFTISQNCKNDIINFLKIDQNKIITVTNGTDVHDFFPVPNLKKEEFILFVGTLQPRKNLITLLKAYVSFAQERKEKLVIVGGKGWKHSHIAEFVMSLAPAIREKIDFKGYIKREEVIDLYQKAKLFVAPSLHEGFGLIILEAMASKTAVVTSPVGAVPEYFQGQVEFADPYNEKDLAEKILNLLDDSKRRDSLIQKGFEAALKLTSKAMAFDWLEKVIKISLKEITLLQKESKTGKK